MFKHLLKNVLNFLIGNLILYIHAFGKWVLNYQLKIPVET